MRILLIQPFPFQTYGTSRYSNRIPLGILYIGEVLSKLPKIEIHILDLSLKKPDFNFSKFLLSVSPEISGISIHSTAIASFSYYLAKKIRINFPGCLLLAGGAHASAAPLDVMNNSCFDIVVTGEGEEIVCELVRRLSINKDITKVAGIYLRKNNKIIYTGVGQLPDLNSLPHMPSNLIDLKNYELKVPYLPSGKTINLITSRGCSYKCQFCSYKSLSGTRPRFRNANMLFTELNRAVYEFGISNFYFVDDNFLCDFDRIFELKKMLYSHNLKINWKCQARAEFVTQNIVIAETIASMGCKHVSFGIESGDQNVLNSISKHLRVSDGKTAIKLAKTQGIAVRCFLMVGLPFQTNDSINKTIDFLYETQPDEISVNIFVPFPGSPIYVNPAKWGISFINNDNSRKICRLDWFDNNNSKTIFPVVETKWMSSAEILLAKDRIEEAFSAITGHSNSDIPIKRQQCIECLNLG
jgi:radical SAM superfamily enzyme YgiQ (UPF0313 family)